MALLNSLLMAFDLTNTYKGLRGQVAKALKKVLKEANWVCEHDRPLLSEIMDFFESERDFAKSR